MHSGTNTAIFLLISVAFRPAIAADEVHFGRDVLPILSNACFQCHGPDEANREADLRLDKRKSAVEKRGDYAVIVPHNPGASELIARVTSGDADLVMPPADSHRKPLTESQINTLRSWIKNGAGWGKHWAFEKPVRPALPLAASPLATSHPIDAFVRQRLADEGLSPAPQAPKHTLIRRLSFDLTGLPPTVADVDSFLANDSPRAYETLVEQTLRSPYYGERMAMWWLDAARYADTDGYQGDATRNNWPWRDWVVQAFRDNMPFNQFTVEQFAGDLLDDATQEQVLATCFHRNHMTNGEGGRHPEESRIDYVIDRVNTMGTVWLGLTLGCAQCHSHKFDPISQHDYYRLFAFFDNIDEDGKAGRDAKPFMKYKSPHAQRAIREAERIVAARKPTEATARRTAELEFNDWLAKQLEVTVTNFVPWHPLRAIDLRSVEGTLLTQDSDSIIRASGPNPRQDDYHLIAAPPSTLPIYGEDAQAKRRRITGIKLEILPHPSHTEGKLTRGHNGEFIITDVKLQVRRAGDSQLHDVEFSEALASAERSVKGRNYGNVRDTLDDDPRNGWTTESFDATKPYHAIFALTEPLLLAPDQELVFVMLHRSTVGDANVGRYRVSVTDQPGPAVRSLEPMPLETLAQSKASKITDLDDALRARLLEQFLSDHAAYQRAKIELQRAKRQLSECQKAAVELDVMILDRRNNDRTSHVLERGVWDQKGDVVTRAFPTAILADTHTDSRLDLAKWLVSEHNPLTARVVVNHLWQICFGSGLVRTPEDFGLQGELPTHPRVLDWLAVELIEHNWDLQHILRMIVTSQTYQQSSHVTGALHERDPDNRLLARGSRFRLPAWMIRDAALHSSGLLNAAIGGPPVRPYQPDGVWAEMFMGRFRYEPSQGDAQFRRTLYAFWRRSAAPTFLFDSAQRRVCEVRPRLTNTPLQALALLNDGSVLESSRALARQCIEQFETPNERLSFLFRNVISRNPTAPELSVLQRELAKAFRHYSNAPDDAKELLDFGQPERRTTITAHNLAPYMIVASMVYNLDEAITHE